MKMKYVLRTHIFLDVLVCSIADRQYYHHHHQHHHHHHYYYYYYYYYYYHYYDVTAAMLVSQTNSVGVELFSYVNAFCS